MPQTLQRYQGETGNPITGILSNRDASLVIPEGTPVTVSGRRVDTGELLFAASPVTITNYTTRAFTYEPAAYDWDTPCTLKLIFKVAMASGKPVYVPDFDDYDLLLKIKPL